MSDPRVEVLVDAGAAAQRTAELLAAAVAGALTERGAAHVALSGGRTPGRAYALLGALVADWRGVHLWFADERCVDAGSPLSNARLVRETLGAPGASVHRIRGELGPDAAAQAYERELGDVVLDVVLLGLGEDAHTASLFPRAAALGASGRVAPVHDAPKDPPRRVTLTLETIAGARRRIMLVTGEGKSAALAAALGDPSADAPGSLVERSGLVVIADRSARPRG